MSLLAATVVAGEEPLKYDAYVNENASVDTITDVTGPFSNDVMLLLHLTANNFNRGNSHRWIDRSPQPRDLKLDDILTSNTVLPTEIQFLRNPPGAHTHVRLVGGISVDLQLPISPSVTIALLVRVNNTDPVSTAGLYDRDTNSLAISARYGTTYGIEVNESTTLPTTTTATTITPLPHNAPHLHVITLSGTNKGVGSEIFLFPAGTPANPTTLTFASDSQYRVCNVQTQTTGTFPALTNVFFSYGTQNVSTLPLNSDVYDIQVYNTSSTQVDIQAYYTGQGISTDSGGKIMQWQSASDSAGTLVAPPNLEPLARPTVSNTTGSEPIQEIDFGRKVDQRVLVSNGNQSCLLNSMVYVVCTNAQLQSGDTCTVFYSGRLRTDRFAIGLQVRPGSGDSVQREILVQMTTPAGLQQIIISSERQRELQQFVPSKDTKTVFAIRWTQKELRVWIQGRSFDHGRTTDQTDFDEQTVPDLPITLGAALSRDSQLRPSPDAYQASDFRTDYFAGSVEGFRVYYGDQHTDTEVLAITDEMLQGIAPPGGERGRDAVLDKIGGYFATNYPQLFTKP